MFLHLGLQGAWTVLCTGTAAFTLHYSELYSLPGACAEAELAGHSTQSLLPCRGYPTGYIVMTCGEDTEGFGV